MTVINDMLRSPPLSAHLFAQTHSDILKPMHGRPRSRTVPSTPLVEAPMAEPVELPGSFPLHKRPSVAHFSLDGTRQAYLFDESPANASFGSSIIRPHSSPQEATHPTLDGPNVPTPRISPRSNLLSPARASPRSRSTGPRPIIGSPLYDGAEEETLVGSESSALSFATGRPTLSNLLDDALKTESLPSSIANSRTASSNAVPQVGMRNDSITLDQAQQADSEAVLMQQISSLRTSHDAHVCSLKETHEREIASHRSYISFLESRKTTSNTSSTDSKYPLTIDTSQPAKRTIDLPTSDASANTLQSFELSLESQKRASLEASQGVEALKRKLSLCRKAQADAVDVRRERDQLRDAVSRSDRRILQLKDIVRRAKENEKAMKNATVDLEARLVLANNERTDVLEGYHEACAQIEKLSKKQIDLSEEEKARNRSIKSPLLGIPSTSEGMSGDTSGDSKKLSQTFSDAGAALVNDCDALMQQVQELRRTIASKDAHIRRLEEVISFGSMERRSAVTHSVASQSSWLSELQNSLEEHRKMLATAQADSERYNSLLHNELRRQSRSAAERANANTPKIEAEAFVVASEKMMRIKAQSRKTTADADAQEPPLTILLERELEHCIKEIIMYKSVTLHHVPKIPC